MDQFVTSINTPPALDLSKDVNTSWNIWKEQWDNYAVVVQLSDKPDSLQKAIFLNTIGADAFRIYKSLDHPDGMDKTKLATVIKMFDIYSSTYTNVIHERYLFNSRSQESGESIDTFIRVLKDLAKNCLYPDAIKDELIRDRIVCGIRDNALRKRLLREKKLTLANTIDMCRGEEATTKHVKGIAGDSPDNPIEVNALTRSRGAKSQKKPPQQRGHKSVASGQSNGPHRKTCLFCGRHHPMVKSKCPAYGATCNSCGEKNHYSSCCKKSKKPVNAVSDDTVQGQGAAALAVNPSSTSTSVTLFDDNHVYVVSGNKSPNAIFAEMHVGGKSIKFQLDTGAAVNILPLSAVPAETTLRPSTHVLKTYDGSTLLPKGAADVRMDNPMTQCRHLVPFEIVDGNVVPLLGANAVQKLNLVTVNERNFKRIAAVSSVPRRLTSKSETVKQYASVFKDTIGNLPGPVHLKVDAAVTSRVLPARRLPVALEASVKDELTRLVSEGVLQLVDKPSPWVSQMTVVVKPDGKKRICIDSRSLNTALMREHHTLPTLDSMLHKLKGAKVFSKADLRNGYWHVHLDEASSDLTVMATPFGRYKWRRLPFGLNVSSEIFQKRIQCAFEDMDNVHVIADDALICGYGDTLETALKDHDRALHAFLQRCQSTGIVLNPAKLVFKTTQTSFMGHILTDKGILPDPAKVQAITELPYPTDVASVRRLCGLVNYLSRFIPHLADTAKPLHDLTCKGIAFTWEAHHTEAVEKLRKDLSSAPLLAYFDNNAPVTIQCDASEFGLGAVLLQRGRPVAYASRAMTDPETRYAQIEKELLAVVFAMTRFDQMTYGRPVTVVSDHKPLAAIFQKPLSKAPRRLQSMMMQLQRYHINLVWLPGKEMHIADCLSRAYLTREEKGNGEIALFSTLAKTAINFMESLPFAGKQLESLKSHTDEDETLQLLKTTIIAGWPENRNDVQPALLPYWSYRDELSVTDGVIFKGSRLVVPSPMRARIKDLLHVGHRGIDATLRHARDIVFWPRMTDDIKQLITSCETCQAFPTAQQSLPLQCHELTERPWQRVGVDLFNLQGKDYLATVDYMSNFIEVDRLYSTTTSAVRAKLSAHFARHGVPDVVVSDNGPQFSSQEFTDFAQAWNFQHKTSSPHHPTSNGMAESAVKTLKKTMMKCANDGTNVHQALLNLRNTPRPGIMLSPAQLLMSRRTKIVIPMAKSLLLPTASPDTTALRRQRQIKQAALHDKHARDVPPLAEGDTVRMKPTTLGQKQWIRGSVIQGDGNRSYEIQTDAGATLRRNRQDLRPATASVTTQSGRAVKPVQRYGFTTQ